MQLKPDVSEYRARLTDFAIAKLLGISLEEYGKLSHLPIDITKDIRGTIREFHIRISTNNPPELLAKLDLDSEGYVRLKPEKVYIMYQ
jgi:hypothetical protein